MSRAPTWLQLVAVALGAARLTILATSDRISRPWRWWLEHDGGYLGTLAWCPWCAGFWIALAASLAWLRWPAGTSAALLPWAVAFAASGLAGALGGEDRRPIPPAQPAIPDPKPFRVADGSPFDELPLRSCRVCGCTEERACADGCWFG